jgi:hypothetical protein
MDLISGLEKGWERLSSRDLQVLHWQSFALSFQL